MILGEIATTVGEKLGLLDAASLALFKKWARNRHEMICAPHLWKDLLVVYTRAITAGQAEVILPAQFQDVIGLKHDEQKMLPIDQVFLFSDDPGLWDRTGTLLQYAHLPAVGARIMPVDEKVTFVSSNAADVGEKVTIVGELDGEEIRETLTLNGTTVVESANLYDLAYTISKETTAGSVTVKGLTTAATLVTLQDEETQRRHCRLRLLEKPSAALTLMVLAKRNAPPLIQDSDAPAVGGLDAILEAFTLGDAYEWQRQTEDAMDKRKEAIALLEQLKQQGLYLAATSRRLSPAESVGENDRPWE